MCIRRNFGLQIEARFDENGCGLWAVERREDGAFLGFTGLATTASLGFVGPAAGLLGPPPIPEAEIGWRFARFAWGQGYATEAARAALRFGFESAEMHEIVSFTSTLNLASIRVMERIGLHRVPPTTSSTRGCPKATGSAGTSSTV